jgi:hypothetical protein
MVYTCGTMGKHSRWMLKNARRLTRPTPARQDAPFRGQGRSERRADAYPQGYVEGLSDARTLLADFFSILLESVHTYA